jgi:hypothetical protein
MVRPISIEIKWTSINIHFALRHKIFVYVLKMNQLIPFREIHTKHKNRLYCSVHNLGCVSLVIYEVTAGLLRTDHYRQLVGNLTELQPRKYEGWIVSVFH